MSDCCTAAPGGACALPSPRDPAVCPACGRKGKPVGVLTVKHLVRDHMAVQNPASYSFCRTRDCEVVYFAPGSVFRKPDLKVRVGLKESADPIPLCYCFGYDESDIRRDMEEHGRTEIPQRIKAEVKAGMCACETRNPSGKCCLGEVQQALQKAQALVKKAGVALER